MSDSKSTQLIQSFYKEYNQKSKFLNHYHSTLIDQHHLRSLKPYTSDPAELRTYLQLKHNLLPFIEVDSLLATFHDNLHSCERTVRHDRAEFDRTVAEIFGQSYHLAHIARLSLKSDAVQEKYQVVLQNLQNLQHIYHAENIRTYLGQRYAALLDEMSATPSAVSSATVSDTANQQTTPGLMLFTSASSILSTVTSDRVEQRLQNRITKINALLEVPSEEIRTLKKTVFTSADSLRTREAIGRKHVSEKRTALMSNMRSICDLEGNIVDMQKEMTIILAATGRAKEILREKKQQMNANIEDMVRFNRMLATLDVEIDQLTSQHDEKLAALEEEMDRIRNDPTLTAEERAQKLLDIGAKIQSEMASYSTDLASLQAQRSELTASVSNAATIMSNLQSDLLMLERSKEGKTSEERAAIDLQIAALKSQIEIVGKSIGSCVVVDGQDKPDTAGQTEYFVNENGRYYIGPNGEVVYKASSTASEYVMEGGVLRKVKDALRLQTDEMGDFYVNELGEKVYHRKYEFDEFGRYYTDAEGNRIYRRGPNTSEYMMVDGKLVKMRNATGTKSDESMLDMPASDELGLEGPLVSI